jgi:acetyl esterase/lipase
MTTPRTTDTISRRAALAGLGAGGLGLALAATTRHAAAQETTPDAIRYERDVVYGEVDGRPLLLDVARPSDRADPRQAVVVIHGGGFVFGDRSFLAAPLPPLAAAGFVAFNIEYRLFGDDGSNPWPAQLVDAQRAVRWVRANAAAHGIDPDRVAAYGHSAGGNLAAHLGTRDTLDNADPALTAFSSRVSCVVDIAGDTDPTIPWTDPGDTARRRPARRDARGGPGCLRRFRGAHPRRRGERAVPDPPRHAGHLRPDRALATAGRRPARGRGRSGVRGVRQHRPPRLGLDQGRSVDARLLRLALASVGGRTGLTAG